MDGLAAVPTGSVAGSHESHGLSDYGGYGSMEQTNHIYQPSQSVYRPAVESNLTLKLKKKTPQKPKTAPKNNGRPRSMSDPNISLSEEYEAPQRPEGWVGAYSPNSRKLRIARFLEKRNNRVWTKKVKYDVRKNFADSRMRVKGRFVKKEDEVLMRELMSLT